MPDRTDTLVSDTWLRLSEAAAVLGVSANTLRRWSEAGHVPCFRSPGGHRRYHLTDIDTQLRASVRPPDRPAPLRSHARSLAPQSPVLVDDIPPTDPALAPASHDGHIRNLAVTTASGLNLPVAVIAWLVDNDTAAIVAAHPSGISPLGLPVGDLVGIRQIPLAEMVLSDDRTVAIGDLATSTELSRRDHEYFHRVLGLRAAIAAPLHDGARPQGVLLAASPSSPHRFAAADITFFGQLAKQAAAACLAAQVGSAGRRPGSLREHVRPHRPIDADARRAPPATDHLDSPALKTVERPAGHRHRHLEAPDNLAADAVPRGLRAACLLLGGRAAVILRPAGTGVHTLTSIEPLEPDDDDSVTALADLMRRLDTSRLRAVTSPALLPDTPDSRSALAVPLRRDGARLGHLLVALEPRASLDTAQATAVGEFLSALVCADEEARRAVTRNAELETVIQATVEDRELLDYPAILYATARRLATAAKAPVVDIYAVEGDVIRALLSYENGRVDPDWDGVTLPLDRYPCSRAAVRSRQVACATSLDDPVLTPEGRSSLEKWGYQAQLSVPLMACGKVIGLAEISDYRPRDFHNEIEVIRRLADVAGQTLENAALFDQIEQHSRLTRELAALGSLADGSRDEQELAFAFADRLRDVLEVARCDVFTLNGGELHLLARSDADDEVAVHGRPIPLCDYPSTEQALRANRLLLVSDPSDAGLSASEREAYAVSGYRSEAVVPLYVAGTAYGLIDLLDTQPRDFTDFADFLRSTGQLLQAALDQLELLRQLQRRSDILRDVAELGALAAQLHAADIGQLLESVAQRLRTVVDASCCDIFTLESGCLRCRVSVDAGGPDAHVVGNLLHLDRYPTTATALASGEPFVIASPDDPRLTETELDNYADYGFQSEFGIPLVSSDKLVGFLDLFDVRPRDYSEHMDFVRSISQIVAGSLENALLLERLNRSVGEQRLLVESALDFGASLDVDRVLRAMAIRACQVGEADVCDIVIVEGDKARVLVSVTGTIDTGAAGDVYPLQDLTLTATTIATGRPQWRTDIQDDPGPSSLERAVWAYWGARSAIKVPLMVRGEAIGVVSLMYRLPREPAHIELLQGLAQVAAQALANANLYGEIQLRNREAERLNALARQIAASLDPHEISRLAIDELHGLLRFEIAAVALADGDGPSFAYVTPSVDSAVVDAGPDPRILRALIRATHHGATLIQPGDDLQLLTSPSPQPDIRSIASVSLREGDLPIGVLQVASRLPDAFSHRDLALLDRVATHIGIALTNARLYSRIKRLHLGNLRALSSALSAKDHYTLGHTARVAAYMVLLGHELGWSRDRVEQIEEAAYLHDVGKIGISDRVLTTAAPLNAREWELMREHPSLSADIIEPLFAEDLVAGVRHHHERWDGEGYPSGLAGDQIPLVARAMCVADAYDAMSYRRPYRDPLTYPECREELDRCSGKQFDPEMVRAFLRVLDELHALRTRAREIAAVAAARISPHDHDAVIEAMTADVPEYRRIADTLSAVLAENPGPRFMVTLAPVADEFVVVVDPAEEPDWSPPGESVAGAGELAADFAGAPLDQNVLYVDRFGVWAYGTAPIRNSDGDITALVSVDMPVDGRQYESRAAPSGVKQSFASMLHTTAEQLSRARLDAITDYLTGLYNHRYLHERLTEELERAHDSGMPLSLLFLDIDQFKDFNDLYGHSLGDTALRAVAAAIDGAIRRVDLAARYGGEEFIVVLVDTDSPGALDAAERIRAAIGGAEIAPGVRRISVSIGVATYPEDAEFKEELIDKADWAMYMAKRGGRNRVSAFSSGQLRLDLGDTSADRDM